MSSHLSEVSKSSVNFRPEGQTCLVYLLIVLPIEQAPLLGFSRTIMWCVCGRRLRDGGGSLRVCVCRRIVLRRGLLVEVAQIRLQTHLDVRPLAAAPHLLTDSAILVQNEGGNDENARSDHDNWPEESGQNDEDDG